VYDSARTCAAAPVVAFHQIDSGFLSFPLRRWETVAAHWPSGKCQSGNIVFLRIQCYCLQWLNVTHTVENNFFYFFYVYLYRLYFIMLYGETQCTQISNRQSRNNNQNPREVFAYRPQTGGIRIFSHFLESVDLIFFVIFFGKHTWDKEKCLG